METYNKETVANQNTGSNSNIERSNKSGRVIAGLIVVTVGLIFLAREAGVYIPRWIFSWEVMFIGLGLFIGFRNSFKNMSWLIFIVIGSIFLLDDFFPYSDISDFVWPIVIISAGLFMIFRPSKKNRFRKDRWEAAHVVSENSSDDFIDSTVVFGGVKKNIISKNFRGGDTTTFFGGTELNLTQADVQGKIELDITQVFGGTKLVVPPHWKIQSEDLVSIFGGVDDKRPMISDLSQVDHSKILVLKGTCIFGGIDIKSY
jgi:predicted membrane protein